MPERGVKGTKVFAGKPQCVCAPRTPCPSVRDPPFSPRKAKPICFSLVYTLLLILRLVLVGSLCFQFKRALRIPSGAGVADPEWGRGWLIPSFLHPASSTAQTTRLVTPGFIPTLPHLPRFCAYFLKEKNKQNKKLFFFTPFQLAETWKPAAVLMERESNCSHCF